MATAPSWVAVKNAAFGSSGTSRTAKSPASTEVGHLLEAEVFVLGSGKTIVAGTAPAGFSWTAPPEGNNTTVNGEYTVALFYGIATEAGEKDYKFEWSGASSNAVTINAVKDFDPASPVADIKFKNNTTASTAMKFASVSPAMTNTLSILTGQTSATGTPAEGYSERVDTTGLYVCTAELAAAGASGEKTATNSVSEKTATWHLAIAPLIAATGLAVLL